MKLSHQKLKLLYLMKILLDNTDEEHFISNVKVAVSPHFLSWIISFGSHAKIVSPESVIEQLRDLLDKANDNYKQ